MQWCVCSVVPPDACQGFGCSPFGPELKGSGWLEMKFITLQSLGRDFVVTIVRRSLYHGKLVHFSLKFVPTV
jgi:hypothetical protein